MNLLRVDSYIWLIGMEGDSRETGTTIEPEENWIVSIDTPYLHPLIDPADGIYMASYTPEPLTLAASIALARTLRQEKKPIKDPDALIGFSQGRLRFM